MAERLELSLVKVELELRFKVPKPSTDYNYKDYEITYYRNIQYPNITFRSYKSNNIESKELVERTTYKGTKLVLSIEQEDVDIPVVKTGFVRRIKRAVIKKDPLIEIINENDEYTIEIEFTLKHLKEIDSLINQYKCKWWPAPKPMEISLLSLTRKLSYQLEHYTFSHKADGLHIMMFDDIIIYDTGNTCIPSDPQFVYEGEIVDDVIWLYDCLIYDGKNISKLPYRKRWEHIPKNRKPIYILNNLDELRSWCFMPPPFKSDGYIITGNKKVYKSKWISTVDLLYNNGDLYLGNDVLYCLSPTLNLENGLIYEFEGESMKLVRKRTDKITPNYKWVGESNQLYKYAYGIGVPSVRMAHNKLKYQMLNYIRADTLLDIGSGKGGDYDKWIHLGYRKIFALDPELQLRKHHHNIIEIRENIKDLMVPLEYDAISIFFVPWDDSFIPYILKAKYFAISFMIPPDEDITDVYSIKSNLTSTEICIPNTSTAVHITESRVDYEKIFKEYLYDWNLKEFKIDIYKECIEYNLIKYYKHYVFTRK